MKSILSQQARWVSALILGLAGAPVWALSPTGGDDTTTIQNAINGCSQGGTVLFSAGTYRVSSTLQFKSNCTYQGQGNPVLQGQGVLAQANSNMTIDGLVFSGGNLQILGPNSGPSFLTNVTVSHCTFQNISLLGANESIMAGIYLTNADGIIITRNTFSHIIDNGAPTQYQFGPNPPVANGVHVYHTKHVQITYNTFDYMGQGISFNRSDDRDASETPMTDILLKKNLFTRTFRSAIEFQGIPGPLSNVVIDSNEAHGFINPYGDSWMLSFSVGAINAQIINNFFDADVVADTSQGSWHGLPQCIELGGTNTLVTGNTCVSSNNPNSYGFSSVSGGMTIVTPGYDGVVRNNTLCMPPSGVLLDYEEPHAERLGHPTQVFNNNTPPCGQVVAHPVNFAGINADLGSGGGSPAIGLSKTSFSFSATAGGANPANQTLSVSNSGVGTLNWSVTSDAGWLGTSPVSGGNGPTTVSVGVNSQGLAVGSYTGHLSFKDVNASNSPQTVTVLLNVSSSGGGSGNLILDPGFESQSGGGLGSPWVSEGPVTAGTDVNATDPLGNPGAHGGSTNAYLFSPAAAAWGAVTQTVAVTPNTNYTLTSWFNNSNNAGFNGSFGVRTTNNTAIASTPIGAIPTYRQLTVTFNSGANSSVVVFAGYTPSGNSWLHADDLSLVGQVSSPARIALSQTSFSFSATAGGANPSNQTLSVSNSGSGTLNWSAVSDAGWLGTAPVSGGNGPTTVAVGINIQGLAAGTYTGHLTFSDANASNSPQTATVTLTVSPASSGGGSNILLDSGFESQAGPGLATPWTSEGPSTTGIDTNGVDPLGNPDQHGGAKEGYIWNPSAAAWSAIKQTVSVTPNTNYTLTAWFDNSNDAGFNGSLGVRTTGNTAIASTPIGAIPTYRQLTVTFNSGVNSSVVVFAGFTPSGNTWLHMDDFALTATGGTTPPPTPTPYSGTPAALPGTVQAENYDLGGEAVAYHDTTSGNTGGAYRSDNVDIQAGGTGFNLGWVDAGEWLIYTVNVAQTGTYDLQIPVAALGAGGTFHVEFGGVNKTGTMTVPNTGSWSTWIPLTKTGIALTAGVQQMKLVMDTAGAVTGNFDYLTLTASGGSTPASTPYSGTPAVIPGIIEAEKYDLGGPNVAYMDTSAGNSGAQFRTDNVDIETATDSAGGTFNLGWTQAGEWLLYTVNVPAGGTYTLSVRLASPAAAGSLHIEMNGVNKSGAISVPNTGGSQTWTTLNVKGIALSAGVQKMKLVFDSVGTDGYGPNLNFIQWSQETAAAPVDTTAPAAPGNSTLTGPTTYSMLLNWNAATDNVGVTGYRMDVAMDTGFSSFVGGYNNFNVGNVTSYKIYGLTPGTLYYARVRAYDAAGNISANSAAVSAKTFIPLRINAGGPTYTDSTGKLWMMDTDYQGGGTFSTTHAITNTSDAALYQTIRYGNFTYTFQVPNGPSTVNLRFAEIYWTTSGKRLFNVLINGQQVLTNFDIFTAAGGAFRAVTKSFPVTVNNGQITVQFVSTAVDQADICALEITNGSQVVYGLASVNGMPTTPVGAISTASPASAVRVYPNPWRADKSYARQITLDRLPLGSTVKVFTVAGRLVKTLTPAADTVVWDLTTDQGDPAASGIYIYLITGGDTGSDPIKGKVVIIK